jgi:uncharacterized protein YecE (DUF72 family)
VREHKSRQARVGVAGWSYPDWEGIVYPSPKQTRFDPLAYLAGYFDTIEINSTFYRPARPATADSWARRCEENLNFRFTVKLYKVFTHERSGSTDDEKAVKEGLAPLMASGRLGALLLQFPWSFKNEAESQRYLKSLLNRFREFPRVLEVRHASWDLPAFYEYLAAEGVGFCNIDQPRIGRSIGPSKKSTGRVGYVRLHGRNYQDWFRRDAGRDARYDYLYSEKELDPWLEKIEQISEDSQETYVITNNHFRGKAVVNALQIKSRLRGDKVEVPETLINMYPELRHFACQSETPRQAKLF